MPLSGWKNYLRENIFKNAAGFYELPYLANNPQLMIDSILLFPVSEHKSQQQSIITNNDFIQGVMHYRKIEDGLWLMATHFGIKQNLVCRAMYDKNAISDHYFLSFAVFEYRYPVNNDFTQFAKLISTTCTFYKPYTEVDTYFYENTCGKFYNIVFSKQWAEKNLAYTSKQHENELKPFLIAETGFINWLDIVPDAEKLSKKIWAILENNQDGVHNTDSLKTTTHHIITDFFKATNHDKRIKNFPQLSNSDYASVAKAENIILKNLMNPFCGVESISLAVNISPTKLKTIFKTVFGFSMLQYHKEKNMLLAMQLIKNSTMQIRYLALLTGFESASKFTAAFKKRFNILPSSIRIN